MDKLNLPFKVGDQIESMSFDQGYRGAWFRCTIRGLKKIKGTWHYEPEYHDFPDEELNLEKIYQMPSTSRSKKQLMIRPPFPPIRLENQIPNLNTISDVIVVVDGVWKVGDLVDWFTTGCYWSGSVTEILGKEMVQIDLLPPPVGEGSSYKVQCKELRPSLDWSLERGWMVPCPKDKENHRCCARLIKPMSSDIGRTDTQATSRDNVSSSSPTSAGSLPSQGKSEQTLKRPRSTADSMKKDRAVKNKDFEKTSCSDSVPVAKRTRTITKSEEKDKNMDGRTNTKSKEKDKDKDKDKSLDVDNGVGKTSTEPKEKDRSMDVVEVVGKTSCSDSDSDSSSFYGDASGEMVGAVANVYQHIAESLKKTDVNEVVAVVEQCSDESLKAEPTRNNETIVLNSMYCDSLEAAFMDLEELATRVKWLKGILKPGSQQRHGWKFIEHRAR